MVSVPPLHMGNLLVLILEPANVAAGAQEAMEVGVPKAAVGL